MPVNSFKDYPMNWRPDRKELKRPLYRSLLALLQHDIASGILRPGVKMPPQRELADFLDINFTTVTRVYNLAKEQGLLYAKTGSGTFVSENASENITITLGNSGKEMIDLGLVSSFEGSNQYINTALRKIAEGGQIPSLTSYDFPTGLPYQKEAGIAWLHWLGLDVSSDDITIAAGGLNALTVVLVGLFPPGSRIAVPQYCFSNFLDLARMLRIHLVPVPEDACGILPERLDQICRMTSVNGIYLMPTGSNPTCSAMTPARREAVVSVLKKHQIILLEDDTYGFLSVGRNRGYEHPLTADLPDSGIYICSMSKSLCSGARISYLAFPPSLRDSINRAFYNIDVKTSSIDAELISQLIFSGNAMKIVEEKRRKITEADRIFRNVFPASPVPPNPDCYYRWLPIPDHRDGKIIEKEFISKGVQIYHSDRFLTGPRDSGQYIRISLSSSETPEMLQKGLETIAFCLSDLNMSH